MKLADFMKLEELTDADLAAKVNRDRSSVTRWRRGDNKPDFDALIAIHNISGGRVTAQDFVKTEAAQ
jgi:transcriptional regulator with XRE-family HTH domain